jgi:quercetin dioxygenase-like cupin family protein
MKKLSIVLLGIFILILSSFNATAQDWEKVNPKMNQVLADTTFFRVTEVTLEPGQKSAMHSHPVHFYYAITDAKLMVHFEDGENELYDLKSGDSGMSKAERPHITENAGKSTAKFLIVDLKEHPYKAPMKK